MEPMTPGTGAATASKTLRILVVDDHSDSATSMQLLIRRKRHEVEVAFGGDEAMRVGEVLKPSLVFLDLSLPGKDGAGVAREMRATEWGKNAFLVATTGWGAEADRQRALDAGFDRYLTKPIEPETLYLLLEAVAKLEAGKEESGPAPLTPA
jgi:DNA-binding response OmpR family regulator